MHASGGQILGVLPLHLRPGTREHFLGWLAEHDPALHQRYLAAYRGRSYLDPSYGRWLDARPCANSTRRSITSRPCESWCLGAGFGGLELSTRLSDEFGTDIEIVLIDQSDSFVFGFSKLDVMFGRTSPECRPSPLPRPRQARACASSRSAIRSIDPAAERVETDAGTFDADILVVALGADLHPEATPGLVEGGHEFYTVAGAFALRDVLADFERRPGHRRGHLDPVQVPTGAERDRAAAARLPDRTRAARDVSEISLVMPMGVPIPPSTGGVRARCSTAFAERGIDWYPERLVRELDPAAQGGDARRRHRAAVRPVPRRPGPPRPAGRARLRADRRRLDPGRPVDPRDALRRRRRTRSAT